MLTRILAVRPGEGRTLALLGGHAFVLLASTTIYGTAADALFLQAYPARYLPLAYAAGALLSIGVSWGYARAAGRLAARTLSTRVTPALVGLLVLLRAALAFAPGKAPLILLVINPAFGVVVGVEIAGLVARTLDSRSSRRLYPALTGIGGLGATLGGFATAFLAGPVGTGNLLLLAALLVLGSLASIRRLRGETRRPQGPRPASWRRVLGLPFPRALVLGVVLTGVVQVVVKYQMSAGAKEALAPGDLPRYLGTVYGWLNAASIPFGILLSRPLLARIGVGAAMLVHPGTMLVLAAFGIASPGLAAATGALVGDRLLRQNLQRPLWNIATLPLAESVRARAALALRGTLEPPVTTLVSLGILATSGFLPWPALSWVVAGASAAALLLAGTARRLYAGEVVSALHARRLRVPEEDREPVVLDGRTREALLTRLSAEDPEQAVLALRLLRGRADARTVEVIRERWTSWSARLRREAVLSLGEDAGAEAVRFLREASAGADDDLRAALLRVGALDAADEDLALWLEGPSSDLAAEAASALSARRGPDAVRPTVTRWLTSGDAHANAAAARVLTRSPDPAAANRLVPLLGNPRSFADARAALLVLGRGALPALLARARDVEISSPVLSVLAEAGEGGRHSLITLLADGDEEMRYRAARALAGTGRSPKPSERALVETAIEREIAAVRACTPPGGGTDPRCNREAESQRLWAIERLFGLLSLREPARPWRRIFLSLADPEPSRRAFAVEALDEILVPPWREQVLALVEEGAGSGATTDPWLLRLAVALAQPGFDPAVDRALLLQQKPLFAGWTLRDLERIPTTPSESLAGADVLGVPLEAVHRAILSRPRCARPWLEALARRFPPAASGAPDVSGTFLSLASRVPVGDGREDGDLSLWERTFFLRRVPLFEALPPETLLLVAQIAKPAFAPAGTTIVREGTPARHLYVVRQGCVEVSSGGRSVAMLRPPDAFGIFSLLGGELRPATARALEPSDLLGIDRIDFLDLLETHPALVRDLTGMLLRPGAVAPSDVQRGGAASSSSTR